jgi:hypothetical protein
MKFDRTVEGGKGGRAVWILGDLRGRTIWGNWSFSLLWEIHCLADEIYTIASLQGIGGSCNLPIMVELQLPTYLPTRLQQKDMRSSMISTGR